MAIPKRLRLSPSGPFVTDAVTDVDLQTGPGSTGLIWRAQGASDAVLTAFNTDTLTPVTGLATAWVLPAGYHYDFQARLWIRTTLPQATVARIDVAIQAELASAPGVWVPVHNGVDTEEEFFIEDWGAAENDPQSGYIHIHNVDYQPGANVTGLRVVAQEVPTGGANMSYAPNQCMLRAEQYVL